jgi:hypothetical protein
MAAENEFDEYPESAIGGPCRKSEATNGYITPSDSADLAYVGRGVNVGTTGVVRVTLVGMTDGTYVPLTLAAGMIHFMLVKRIWAAGLTAADISVLR